VDAHLDRCASCRAHAEGVRHSIESQRNLLTMLMSPVATDDARMLAAIRRAEPSADAREGWWEGWRWQVLLRPIPVAIGAVAVVLATLVEVAGGPEDVLVPIGVKAPPPAVSRKPGMFRDYAIIEKLDALENFDTVEVEPLDEEASSERG